jgi:hypothetical protein
LKNWKNKWKVHLNFKKSIKKMFQMDFKRIMNGEKNYRVYDQEYTGLNSIAMEVLVLLP